MRILAIVVAALCLSSCSLLKPGAKPLVFDCTPAQLEGHWEAYRVPDAFAAIQRDAGHDDPAPVRSYVESTWSSKPDKPSGGEPVSDPLSTHLMSEATIVKSLESGSSKKISLLLLSGGGEWGAFGAGYLDGVRKRGLLPSRFTAITGVSTGAIQSLYVAADRYEELASRYRTGGAFVKPGGLLQIFTKGYLYDTAPLRAALEATLCEGDGNCPMLADIVAAGKRRTALYIGFVEVGTGDFKVVNITSLLTAAYERQKSGQANSVREAARCVAAVTLASTAVPVQMRPVQFRDPTTGRSVTYADGGVRLSVFEARLGEQARNVTATTAVPVDIYAIRNGPTVVPAPDRDVNGRPKVDGKPSADAVGLRAYSTLVNQNEVMSIASLRLFDRSNAIKVATADGYGSDFKWRTSPKCRRTVKAFGGFDTPFMDCLVTWGEDKAARHPSPWIELAADKTR